MKRFIFSILCVSIFFIGIGGLVDKVGARFKSDERALEIIKQARIAVGGEDAIKNIKSLTMVGKASKTFNIDGTTRTEQGDLEVALQLPSQFAKMMKFGSGQEGAGEKIIKKDVVIIRNGDKADFNLENFDSAKKKAFIIKKGGGENLEMPKDGASADTHKFVVNKDLRLSDEKFRQNELLRTTFALLLYAPEGSDTAYKFAGVETVDGKSCDVILVESGSSSFKLSIDQSSHLPAMLSYQGSFPKIFKFVGDKTETGNSSTKYITLNKDGSQSETNANNAKIVTRHFAADETLAEYQVRFSDFRNVDGVKLPYKWTQTVGGKPDQKVDVVSYEINPANIADRFGNLPQKLVIRTEKPQ